MNVVYDSVNNELNKSHFDSLNQTLKDKRDLKREENESWWNTNESVIFKNFVLGLEIPFVECTCPGENSTVIVYEYTGAYSFWKEMRNSSIWLIHCREEIYCLEKMPMQKLARNYSSKRFFPVKQGAVSLLLLQVFRDLPCANIRAQELCLCYGTLYGQIVRLTNAV